MARTKIVATIGPASNKAHIIRQMLREGMNVARINFSHGDHETHAATIALLREMAWEEKKVLAILGDLQGPKIRLGNVGPNGLTLEEGDSVIFTTHRGQPAKIHLPHPQLIEIIEPGAHLIIGDGEIELEVTNKDKDTIACKVLVPGLLESRKGVSAPGTTLPISSITEKDHQDLIFICQQKLDYVALSFVRSADDIIELRRLMHRYGPPIPIIAKIEKHEAITNLTTISTETDGMMVARGDLGIEVPAAEVPLHQKHIILRGNELAKPVITATQMLQSMVEHPRPTRAEASDVANAILDGTDAVMLSAETAVGKYPIEAVRTMREIADIIEEEFPYGRWRRRRQNLKEGQVALGSAISASSCAIAEAIQARAIVSTTLSGSTARQIASHRPPTPIMAVSPLEETQRRLALVWGVDCLLVPNFDDTDEMIEGTVAAIQPHGLEKGDSIVITAGVPFRRVGQTNLIQVHIIE